MMDISETTQSRQSQIYVSEPNEDKIFKKANAIIESGHSNAFYILDLNSVR